MSFVLLLSSADCDGPYLAQVSQTDTWLAPQPLIVQFLRASEMGYRVICLRVQIPRTVMRPDSRVAREAHVTVDFGHEYGVTVAQQNDFLFAALVQEALRQSSTTAGVR